MDDIEKVCDRVIVINKGMKVYDNTLLSLTSEYEKVRYVRFIFETQPDDEKISMMGTIVEKNKDFYLFKVSPDKMFELISSVSSTFDVIDLRVESVPLEEIIGKIFEKQIKE